jgi:hypothetical protein
MALVLLSFLTKTFNAIPFQVEAVWEFNFLKRVRMRSLLSGSVCRNPSFPSIVQPFVPADDCSSHTMPTGGPEIAQKQNRWTSSWPQFQKSRRISSSPERSGYPKNPNFRFVLSPVSFWGWWPRPAEITQVINFNSF